MVGQIKVIVRQEVFPPNPAYKEEDVFASCPMRQAKDNREEMN